MVHNQDENGKRKYKCVGSGDGEVAKKVLPKSPTGKGSVPPGQCDPKRVWTKKEKSDALDQRNGKCDGCGNDISVDDARRHHIMMVVVQPMIT